MGNSAKRARGKLELTLGTVAKSIDVGMRTIINIENNCGNPKLQVLYALIRKLKIGLREIFYPVTKLEDLAKRPIRLLIDDCNEEEAPVSLQFLKP